MGAGSACCQQRLVLARCVGAGAGAPRGTHLVRCSTASAPSTRSATPALREGLTSGQPLRPATNHCQSCAAIDLAHPPAGIDVDKLCARASDKCEKHAVGGKLATKPHKPSGKCQCSACCKDCGRPNGIVLAVPQLQIYFSQRERKRKGRAASAAAAVHNQALAADMGAGTGVFAAPAGRKRG